MMQHSIAIEKNSEHNLHIWPNLTCSFRPWLFWMLLLGWLGIDLNVTVIYPWFITSSDLFEQMCMPHLERCACHFLFAQNLAISEQFSLPHVSCLKVERSANIISNISNSDSMIIENNFFTASMFSSIVNTLERPGQSSLFKSSFRSLNRPSTCPYIHT